MADNIVDINGKICHELTDIFTNRLNLYKAQRDGLIINAEGVSDWAEVY